MAGYSSLNNSVLPSSRRTMMVCMSPLFVRSSVARYVSDTATAITSPVLTCSSSQLTPSTIARPCAAPDRYTSFPRTPVENIGSICPTLMLQLPNTDTTSISITRNDTGDIVVAQTKKKSIRVFGCSIPAS